MINGKNGGDPLVPSRGSSIDFNPVIFFGVCVDNDDPLLAGRIRATEDTSISNDNGRLVDPVGEVERETELAEKNGLWKKWSKNDPYVFAPFLPLHVNVIPKRGEAIKVIYYNPDNRTQNKEYIGPLTSQPHKIFSEDFRNGRLHTSLGTRNVPLANPIDNPDTVGSFPNPNDVSIVGRKNSDIVLGMSYKLPQPSDRPQDNSNQPDTPNNPTEYPQILIRSGKYIESPKPQIPSQPKANNKLTFLQLSTFPDTVTVSEIQETVESTPDNVLVYILVEYDIQSPQNLFLTPNEQVNGVVSLYKLPNRSFNGQQKIFDTNTFNLDTEIESNLLDTIMSITFDTTITNSKKNIKETIEYFNNNDWNQLLKPVTGELFPRGINFNPVNNDGLLQKIQSTSHPFYFRPGPNLLRFFKRTNKEETISLYAGVTETNYNNICITVFDFVKSIKLESSDINREGFGLSFSTDKNRVPVTVQNVTRKEFSVERNKQQGFVVGSGEKIILFSHDSNELGQITLDSNYGINQYKLVDDIVSKTQPMVRGDELKEFLTLLVNFVVSHTYPVPGAPPIPVGTDGVTTTNEILSRLNDFSNTVLNQNIRIN